MQPKNICFFNSNIPWGGGEQWHYETALLARDSGFQVSVIANRSSVLASRLEKEQGIHLYTPSLGSLSFLNPLSIAELARIFRKEKVDTALLCLPRDVKAGCIAAKIAGVREIIYRRGIAVPVRNRVTNRLIFRHLLDKLIVNSLETKRCVLSENPTLIEPERIFLLPCSLNLAQFDAKKTQPLIQRRPGEILIGTAGRLTEQKGQRLLIEAAAMLKGKIPSFRVLIAGIGEMEAELKALVQSLGLEQHVEFLGFVTQMRQFHDSLDIFTLPSLWEGFGIAQMEAMSARVPVVAFRVSSIPEVIEEGVTGLLSEPDATALAANLLTLALDDTQRRRMGEAGRKRVESLYDTPQVFREFVNILNARTRKIP